MATKQQCDGCRNEHTTSEKFSNYKNKNLEFHKISVSPTPTAQSVPIMADFDLCMDCTKRVVNFIKGGSLLPVQEAR